MRQKKKTVVIQQRFEDAEKKKKDVVIEEKKPDPLSQLVTTFCRGAMTERSGALQEDPLYMIYAAIVGRSCGEEEEEECDTGGVAEEVGGGSEEFENSSIHVSHYENVCKNVKLCVKNNLKHFLTNQDFYGKTYGNYGVCFVFD